MRHQLLPKLFAHAHKRLVSWNKVEGTGAGIIAKDRCSQVCYRNIPYSEWQGLDNAGGY